MIGFIFSQRAQGDNFTFELSFGYLEDNKKHPPEIDGVNVFDGIKADIFYLGNVLEEMLTGNNNKE